MEQFIEENPIHFIFAIIAFVGFVILIIGLYTYIKSAKTRYWRKVNGEVIESYIEEMRDSKNPYEKTYRPHVKYRYRVGEDEIEANKIFYGDKIYSSIKSRSTKILEQYPIGKTIDVFINPYKMDEAILIKGIRKSTIVTIVVGTAVLISGLLAIDNIEALMDFLSKVFE
jgi:hypothetical protein